MAKNMDTGGVTFSRITRAVELAEQYGGTVTLEVRDARDLARTAEGIGILEAKNDELSKKAKDAEANATEYERERDEMRERAAKLERELEDLGSTARGLEEQVASAERERDRLTDRLRRLEDERDDATAGAKSLRIDRSRVKPGSARVHQSLAGGFGIKMALHGRSGDGLDDYAFGHVADDRALADAICDRINTLADGSHAAADLVRAEAPPPPIVKTLAPITKAARRRARQTA